MQLLVGNYHSVSEPLVRVVLGICYGTADSDWGSNEEQSTSCAQLVKRAAGQCGLTDNLMQVSTDRSSVSQPKTNCWLCCPQRKV